MFLPGRGDPVASRFGPRPLVVAAITAVMTAMSASRFGTAGFAAALLAAVVATIATRRVTMVAIALPIGLATMPGAALEVEPLPMRAGPVAFEGTIEERPRWSGFGDELRFRVRTPHSAVADLLVVASAVSEPQAARRGRGRLHAMPHPGDRIAGIGYVREVSAGGVAFLGAIVETRLDAVDITPDPLTLDGLSSRLRTTLEAGLRTAMAPKNADLVAQLVLGSSARVDDDLLAAHRATGLVHLLAVSGAHASLLAFLLSRAHRTLTGREPYRARRFRALAGATLLVYGAITGLDAPVLRAVVAWLVFQVADASGRRVTAASALAIPALLTAFLLPRDLDRPGFWLSYAAVIGLCVANSDRRARGRLAGLKRTVNASVWALVTTTPFTLGFFGQCAPWTILGTPLLGPLVAIMLGLGLMLAVAAAWLPPLAVPIAWLLEPVCQLYTGSVSALALLPGAPITALRTPWTMEQVGAVLVGLAIVTVWTTRRGLLLACFLVSIPHFVGGGQEAAQVRLCAVGHGQCLAATLPGGSRIVVDCGSRGGSSRAAIALLAGMRGFRTIDWLVLTHADLDHLGAVPHLCEQVAIANALVPEAMSGHPIVAVLRSRGVEVHTLTRGSARRIHPGVEVRAPDGVAATSNQTSLWTRFDIAGLRLLSTGDADADAIEAMGADPEFLRCDVLVLPHHGRLDPAHAPLLERLSQPSLALASNGDRSPPDLVTALRARGRFVLTTAESGEITIALDGSRRVVPARTARITATTADETRGSR
ncbi:MAG: ComEC/Rec2 family competence protein [Planctomycetota bacterium]